MLVLWLDNKAAQITHHILIPNVLNRADWGDKQCTKVWFNSLSIGMQLHLHVHVQVFVFPHKAVVNHLHPNFAMLLHYFLMPFLSDAVL